MTCPQCSAEVLPEQRFCSGCGAPQTAVLGVGGRVLDDETASAESGSPTPNTQHPTPNTPPDERAERRLVTVLFADISGFTAMSEVLDPEDVREIMNIAFEDVVSAVYRYGGWVDKFIGDAVMALFGAPNAHEDDPERAVATALEMRQAVNAVRKSAGLAAATWTNSALAGIFLKTVHIQEMRNYLNPALASLGFSTAAYTDSTLTIGVTRVRKVHLDELRQRVK